MIKKLTAVLLIASLLLSKGAYVVAAGEAQSAGEAHGAKEADKPDKENKPDKGEGNNNSNQSNEANPAQEAQNGPVQEPEPATVVNTQTDVVDHSGVVSDGNVGDTTIETGDATNGGAVYNTANSNFSGSGDPGGSAGSGTTVANTNNGSGSDNNGSATVVSNNDTNQDNSAVIINDLTQASVTGDNSASKNTGGASTIITGDANVSGTVITAANTNVDGVAVSEFNIVDDHHGDFILDFAANCISGCAGGPTSVENSGNGADSANTGTVNNTNNNTTNQTNDGVVTNNINFLADSGNNDANRNTGGDSSIITGDANVAASLLTFLNNNIAGGVMFGVVNIFGDLVGDIILPESVFNQFACGVCGGGTTVANTNNGSGSDNNGTVNNTTNNNVFQSNDADITNNLYLEAESGENSVSRNTNGNNSITTGGTNVDASILNIANMNILGSDMWLVIINEAGNWIGKLFGAPEGSVLAGSEGVEFAVDPNGQINVLNDNNGADSTNNGNVNNTTNNNLTQTNNAGVVNNLNLVANTGGNEANRNTGGSSSIVTGDAQAIANIVNFVNNNIAGGRLLVTFVNVFGSWTGDFLTPGSHKETSQVLAQGGSENSSSNQNSQAGSNSTNTNSSVAKGNNLIAAAGFAGGSSATNSNSGNSNINIKVAGANTADIFSALTKGANNEKRATLNLAWVLLVMPILALAILGKKAYKRGLPRKVL